MHLEYAAHVGHPVTHTSSAARIGLGLTGAILAVAITIGTAGTADVAIMTLVGVAGTYGGVGMDVGKIVDKYLPPSTAGHIVKGIESVLLGPLGKQAARANSDDTKVDCHSDRMVAEGSAIVLLGKTFEPMSRRQDRTKCSGIISDGLHSLIVGGEPSEKGQSISEEDSTAVKVLGGIFSLAGAAKSIAKGTTADVLRGTAKAGAVALDNTGHKDAAALLKASTTTSPGSIKDAKNAVNYYGLYKTTTKTGGALQDIGSGK